MTRPALRVDPGLCGRCRHALLRPTRRGTVYLRCGLANEDSRFARYPPLPVRACPGFRAHDPETTEPADQ